MTTNDLQTLSDHVLHWLMTEEELTDELRTAISSEQTRRTLEVMEPSEMVVLTSKMLHDASTGGYNGFTKEQVKVFGFKWPMPKGWLKSLVGKTVPVSQYRDFYTKGEKRRIKLHACAAIAPGT